MLKYLLSSILFLIVIHLSGQNNSLSIIDEDAIKSVSDIYDYNIDYKEEAIYSVSEDVVQIEKINIKESPIWSAFDKLIFGSQADIDDQLTIIEGNWTEAIIPPMVELLRVVRDRKLLRKVVKLLEKKTSEHHGTSYYKWKEYLWDMAPKYDKHYGPIKGVLYEGIDERFDQYFDGDLSNSKIRLDEIMWGGVKQDGIPPLRKPKTVGAALANYLADTDVVFGVNVNGIAKAYPKRILGWHEMFVDDFGDIEIAGVYCTLCGTVIAYDTEVNGVRHELGTSGFLYRSNKLMYDKKTQSLWNTIEGIPVVGPLVDKGIELSTYPVVTTTWGAWKKQHPYTEVLKLETGHRRDYDEGAAYREYYSTDDLMFPVPQVDRRLYNKDEVFIVRVEGYKEDPVAISVDWIQEEKWTTTTIGDKSIVVVADEAGAISAYKADNVSFEKYKKGKLVDSDMREWEINHEGLSAENGDRLERLPAHRIFWFAWFNTYPDTRLLK